MGTKGVLLFEKESIFLKIKYLIYLRYFFIRIIQFVLWLYDELGNKVCL